MDEMTKLVLSLDLNNLDDYEMKFLHTLRTLATHQQAKATLAKWRMEALIEKDK